MEVQVVILGTDLDELEAFFFSGLMKKPNPPWFTKDFVSNVYEAKYPSKFWINPKK